MAAPAESTDRRREALSTWLRTQLEADDFELTVASADASFRRYFRVALTGRSWIAMDAPPEREDSSAFVTVAGMLREAGVHAPAIHACDLDQGFMLLEDLGDRTYLDVLDVDNADALFDDAIEALLAWQQASRPGVLPDYDRATLETELALFPDWFLARHLEVALDDDERRALATVGERLVDAALEQPRVFVHRDFMPRNLMVADPNPGVIDFQDARYGPVTYDIVCLFRDAFLSWPAERVADWLGRYHARAAALGLPVPEDPDAFRAACDWMGLQRHLKVLGIFARIRYRDGKPHYLGDAPRFIDYVMPVLDRYAELAPLAALFRRHVLPAYPQCAR